MWRTEERTFEADARQSTSGQSFPATQDSYNTEHRKIMIDLPPATTEHEQIESLAYRLYEDEGKPDGRAGEHWARAEEIINSQRLAIATAADEDIKQAD